MNAEEIARRGANLTMVLLATDLALGIVLERTGIYPGAMEVATSIATALYVCVAVAGVALVLLDVTPGDRQTELSEWDNRENNT